MQNALTVDVEDWYQTSDFDFPLQTWDRFEDRVDANTRKLLDLFDGFGVKGTFFVLGCVAKKHPGLVTEIVSRGHELASHGGWHQMLTRMTLAEIRSDLTWSKALLEDLSGQAVTAFRAPSWSVSHQNLEVLALLEELGFRVDSSLQPFRTPLSGMKGVPHHPFHPVVGGRRLNLVEFPSCVARLFGTAFPFSGGLYLRILPVGIITAMLRRVNRERAGMVYVHPWEVDVQQPRITRSPVIRLTHYYHLRTTERKLQRLLAQFQFGRLQDVVAGQDVPDVELAGSGGTQVAFR
ncbi:DUF3473 domain-containing protein [Alicyclobacillus cycloheptanicus]|uniref:Polysaccharide deacetylase family protein (PEP-CTERM system associated) n=1 Tax=Alicyclobacillus cycloheptanicus TaxID=1457 RepID=A0ABT9XIH5_9BACL|nr:DUF3473 domain-containing protein [Alicyclobacillus cycloheptanicus]MDQ0190118.1 polysaccharide deacetylase family protein (PEP-CTERM system associated) [Alicyclobacillus cycloheptanicus]WDM02090.1 DUF3473 domain-containing protein [Alicyclobacillus cycloheptanicus]